MFTTGCQHVRLYLLSVSCLCKCVCVFLKDTLRLCLVYGLIWLVDVLHGDGVGELVEHPLLESLQPLVVVAAAHKLLILQRGGGQQTPWG